MQQKDYPSIIVVIEDMSQKDIIQRRRMLRRQFLENIDQRVSIAEQNLKELVKLTKA